MLDRLWPRCRTHGYCKWQRHPASLVHLIFLGACLQKSDQSLSCNVIFHSVVNHMAPSKRAPIHSSVHSLSHLFIVHTHTITFESPTHLSIPSCMHSLILTLMHPFAHHMLSCACRHVDTTAGCTHLLLLQVFYLCSKLGHLST